MAAPVIPLLRRDTEKHAPPRPGQHPHPVIPPQPHPHPAREVPEQDFWREMERRHERHEHPHEHGRLAA
ncbi:MAG TPA: hypothetical protein VFJ16_23825 [Longimicrobium sp.]|nr:hypothetical protein [Longimicrobium sp.]